MSPPSRGTSASSSPVLTYVRGVRVASRRTALTTSLRYRAVHRPRLSGWKAVFVPTAGGALDHFFSS
jgi:hypothetical protein